MLKVARILELDQADDASRNFLTQWLSDEQGGDHFLAGAGIEANVWDKDNKDDLVAVCRRRDAFATWLGNSLRPSYHRRFGQRFRKPVNKERLGSIWHYKDDTFVFVGNVICMLLSSLIPTSSIFVLYYIDSTSTRLLAITLFSFLFSILMTFVVRGRRYDVFAATMAFAAVQVVFVGGTTIVGTPGLSAAPAHPNASAASHANSHSAITTWTT